MLGLLALARLGRARRFPHGQAISVTLKDFFFDPPDACVGVSLRELRAKLLLELLHVSHVRDEWLFFRPLCVAVSFAVRALDAPSEVKVEPRLRGLP
jgi:hypothetical protein